jgi:hypothetical protein
MTHNPALYFITGASASGKTTLLKRVVAAQPELTTFYFDDIGVPSLEEMNARPGGPAQWQAFATRQWIEKIARLNDTRLVVLEGQTRPSFIIAAAHEEKLTTFHITLIDCSHAERKRRIVEERRDLQLDNLDMYAWAAYLRGQADALNLEVIDTTAQNPAASARALADSLFHFASGVGLELKQHLSKETISG